MDNLIFGFILSLKFAFPNIKMDFDFETPIIIITLHLVELSWVELRVDQKNDVKLIAVKLHADKG